MTSTSRMCQSNTPQACASPFISRWLWSRGCSNTHGVRFLLGNRTQHCKVSLDKAVYAYVLHYIKTVVNAMKCGFALSKEKSLLTQALMLTPAQLRAARALVSWSRDTLGEKSGTSPETVTGFETRGSDPKR